MSDEIETKQEQIPDTILTPEKFFIIIDELVKQNGTSYLEEASAYMDEVLDVEPEDAKHLLQGPLIGIIYDEAMASNRMKQIFRTNPLF